MSVFSSQTGDPYALYHAPLVAERRWRWVAAALFATVIALSLLLALVSLRPPVVIVYDRERADSLRVQRLSSAGSPTVDDARLFFTHVTKLRFGWDSLTVKRDLEQYLRASFKPWREQEQRYFVAPVAGGEGKRPTSRLSSLMSSGMAHHLSLPLDLRAIDCRRRAERGQWDCFAKADLESHLLLSPAQASVPPVRQTLQLVASFLEAPRSAHTPYGLVLVGLYADESATPAATVPAAMTLTGGER